MVRGGVEVLWDAGILGGIIPARITGRLELAAVGDDAVHHVVQGLAVWRRDLQAHEGLVFAALADIELENLVGRAPVRDHVKDAVEDLGVDEVALGGDGFVEHAWLAG